MLILERISMRIPYFNQKRHIYNNGSFRSSIVSMDYDAFNNAVEGDENEDIMETVDIMLS